MRSASLPVVLGVLLWSTLAGCTSEDSSSPASTAPSSSAPASPSPAGSASPGSPAPVSGSPSPAPPDAATIARAVYWLGATKEPRGPRLYREFLARPAGVDAVTDAVKAMLERAPRDPDYTSLWADGTALRAVRREGSVAVVDLSAPARTNGGGSAFEAATVQQLVHTVTAADPSLTAVRLLVEGAPTETLWGSVATAGPLTRAPAAEVLGPVWLDVPEGGTIDGGFGGTATVFEPTVSWQVRQGSRVLEDGFSTASEGGPGRGSWQATTAVPAGSYELWAYESSARDGSMLWLDTKQVTVTR